MPDSDRRPPPYFEYLGKRFTGARFSSGYVIECPKCGLKSVTDHEVAIAADGAMTVDPSVVCPKEGCGWHVLIRDGEAVDA